MHYIYHQKNWPNFIWDKEIIEDKVNAVRYLQGRLFGRIESLGFDERQNNAFQNLSYDVLNTSAIEGENLDLEQVRSSIARKLGLDYSHTPPLNKDNEGIVSIIIDATMNFDKEISHERLYQWHKELFPLGVSGFLKINTGTYRTDKNGPMQVVSGPIGREKIHFEAPYAQRLLKDMNTFIEWFNHIKKENGILEAAICHLWFVTIHPFDDGNGRIARALTDMLLSRSEQRAQRFYSISTIIKNKRKGYYEVLEQTQKGGLDITPWLLWFLSCLQEAIEQTLKTVHSTVEKSDFWLEIKDHPLNERQIKIINMLLDGFTGKLTSTKYAKINKCSQDTAYRDILDLIEKNILIKDPKSAGRSTHYLIKDH